MEHRNRFEEKMNYFFKKFATFIANYPKWTIFISVLSTALLSIGVLRIEILYNVNYLLSPLNCRAYRETDTLLKIFPTNRSLNFDIFRLVEQGRFGTVIIVPKDGKTVLRESIISEMTNLHKLIMSLKVEEKHKTYSYNELCARNDEGCYFDEVLSYGEYIHQIETNEKRIKYPVNSNLSTHNISALNLGGVTVDEEEYVLQAKAIRLYYPLNSNIQGYDQLAEKWEQLFLKAIPTQTSELVMIAMAVSSSFHVETWRFVDDVVKISWILCLVMISFCSITCMTSDWVRSKPLLGISGYISVFLAIASTFGTLSLIGIPCAPLNIVVPFVILGIGIDDSFVLLAAWRRTKPNANIPEKVGETYSEAAIPITITSLTNLLSFCIGMMTPVPACKTLCVYLAMGVFYDFIYQVTFFTACMTLEGYREQKNLHPLTLQPLHPPEETRSKGVLYRLLFTNHQKEEKPPKFMIWCRDIIGSWTGTRFGRFSIIVILFAYLIGAGWSITTLEEGLNPNEIFPRSSYAHQYSTFHYSYFTQYPHQVQVVINATMDYSDSNVQQKVLNIMERFHKSQYIASYDINWLKYYLHFTNDNRFWLLHTMYNLSTPDGFANCLREAYFRHPIGKIFKNDVIFDDDGVRIVAVRFIIFTKDIVNLSVEKASLQELRSIADSSSFPMTVQNFWWINYEQFLITKQLTIQSIGTAVAMIMLVYLLFTLHIPTVICGTFAVLSIEFGIISYMALWGMKLNSITLVCLIMCMGFSIDYCAHISISYRSAKGPYQDRIKYSIYAVGMPILQSCTSTILSLLVMMLVHSDILETFFKIMVLLSIFSLIHAIFILPTLLSIWDSVFQLLASLGRKPKGSILSHADNCDTSAK